MRITKKKTIAILLGICVVAGIFNDTVSVKAVFDESTAVPYSQYASSHTIENSTLFIGTYLIHSQALTDELYEKALDSASESGQSSVYYKSELAGGVWFDISDASSLAEISTAGVMVEESELADLWVTHWTDSSGITHDARSDAAVSIFDIPAPYDLYNLPELEPIRIQYDNAFSSDSSGVNKYYYNTLKSFFELNLRNAVTDECDRQLAGLQACYETLQAQEETELAEIVSTLMSRIDARRRAEVFSQLSQIDDNQLDQLQNRCSGSGFRSGDYDEEQFVENANVADAIGSAMESCQESYIEHSGNMLEEGVTVLKNLEYEDSLQAINMSSGGWNSSMEPALLELRDLYHIQDDIIANRDEELSLLDSKLLSRIMDKYVQSISAGANGTYRAAASNGISEAARRQILEDQKTDVNANRSELQYLVQAKTNRMDSQESLDYVYEQIDVAYGYKGRILSDAFAQKAEETVDAYILWLQQLARSIISSNAELSSGLQDLESRKEELQNQRADALADNDLSAARRYDAMIDAVDDDIANKQAELNAVLTNPHSSASDKARAANEAGDTTLLNNINQMKNSVLEAIADGNLDSDGLDNMISGLAAMGAEDALNEIKDAVDDDGLRKAVEDAIEESRESSLHGLLDGSGGAGGLDLEGLIESLLGAPFGELSVDEKAAATAAADRLGESGSPSMADLALEFLNQCLRENNGYIYEKLNGQTSEYIPLKTVAYAVKYRYIYSDSKREATLSHRGKIYYFEVAKQEVTFRDGSTEPISAPVQMQGLPYVAETDAQKYFSCEAEYIEGSSYGICLNEKMKKLVEELIAAATEGVE